MAPSRRGMLLGAHDEDGSPAGYACLYWTFFSVSASDVVLLDDLYVRAQRRGGGAGEALVAAALDVTRERRGVARAGSPRSATAAPSGSCERVGAQRSSWFEYEIATVGRRD